MLNRGNHIVRISIIKSRVLIKRNETIDKIDIAIGVEGSSDHNGSDDWGADSSPVIYGYTIK